ADRDLLEIRARAATSAVQHLFGVFEGDISRQHHLTLLAHDDIPRAAPRFHELRRLPRELDILVCAAAQQITLLVRVTLVKCKQKPLSAEEISETEREHETQSDRCDRQRVLPVRLAHTKGYAPAPAIIKS